MLVLIDQGETTIPEDVLLEKQDLPRIVIISISVIGVILLFINIGLVAGCMLKRRAKRLKGLFYLLMFCSVLFNLYFTTNETVIL